MRRFFLISAPPHSAAAFLSAFFAAGLALSAFAAGPQAAPEAVPQAVAAKTKAKAKTLPPPASASKAKADSLAEARLVADRAQKQAAAPLRQEAQKPATETGRQAAKKPAAAPQAISSADLSRKPSAAFPAAVSQPAQKSAPTGDLVIINAGGKTQTVTATALNPSKASELRSAREDAEVSTESYILEKLEAERLKDEQKRVDALVGKGAEGPVSAELSPAAALSPPVSPQWYFGEKAFVSLGGGVVKYLGGDNVESNEPAFFLSLGGYALHWVIFDFTGYWSRHYIGGQASYHDTQVIQLSGALSLKFSPLKGRLKPYAGVTGAVTFRNYSPVDHEGAPLDDPSLYSRAEKQWPLAVDVGPSVGMDVALGPRLGVNVNFSWLFNGYTEERKPYYYRSWSWAEDPWTEDLLSEKQSLVLSAAARFYF